VQSLRTMDLKKSPSVAETLDWAKALVMLNADNLDEKTLENTLTVLLKHESDVQRARRELQGGNLPRRSGGFNPTTRPGMPPNPFGGGRRPGRN